MGIVRSVKSIQRRFKSEPFSWVIMAFCVFMYNRVRSLYFSWIFKQKRIQIGPHSIIRGMKNISLGTDFFAIEGLWLEAVVYYRDQNFSPQISIGDQVSLSKDVHITCIDRITIGNRVLFGSKIYLSDHNHGVYSGKSQSPPDMAPAERILAPGGPVTIEDDVWIGDNVVIVGPSCIGRGAIVAANSVVRGDVPPAAVVAGAPARIIKRFNSESNCWERV